MTDMEATGAFPRPPVAWLDVAHGQTSLLVRVGGLGNMHSAVTLSDLLQNECQTGCTQVLLDFSLCDGVDSTFMGTLVRLADSFKNQCHELRIYNLSTRCIEQLDLLGVLPFLNVCGDRPFPEDMDYARLLPKERTPERRLNLIRKAHERLCELDKGNCERFGLFLKSLQDETPATDKDNSETDNADGTNKNNDNKPSDNED